MLIVEWLRAGCARSSSVVLSLGRGARPVLAAVAATSALAAAVPAGAQTFVDPDFSSDLIATVDPYTLVGMRWSPDGDLFVWQKDGVVRVIENGVMLPQPFLDFSDRVNIVDDRGMWGLAFDPNFETNGYVYVTYTYEEGGYVFDSGPKTSRLSRVRANPANPHVMLAGSEVVILGSISNPPCTAYPAGADCIAADSGTHTIGDIRFASDGKMFVGVGDGSSASFADPYALRAQDLDSWNGKILRINPDGTAPGDNPFDDGTNSIRSKVYSYGARNPFRFHLHPQTGEPYAGDVGWNAWEEINNGERGGNYGWPCYEGVGPQAEYNAAFPYCQGLAPNEVVAPLYSYNHQGGDVNGGTAAIGGPFYRGTAYPGTYVDNLFFADFSGNWIRRLTFDAAGEVIGNDVFATNLAGPVSIELGPDGYLYYLDFLSGEIRRILYNGATAVATATPAYGYSPLTVQFSSAGSDSGDGTALSFHWDFDDGTTSAQANPVHQFTNAGVRVYAVELTVTGGSGITGRAQVPVTVGSVPPTPTISQPTDGTPVMPGQPIVFQGAATDPEDGAIPASGLSWMVLLHHNTHVHTAVGGAGPQGNFVVENHGPIGTFSYEIILNATDSSGLTGSRSVTLPIIADTVPPGSTTGLTATQVPGRQISLAWTAASDNAGIGLYRIERCLGSACSNFVEVATSATTSYLDTALAGNTTYRYRVRAADASLNLGAYSNLASATTDTGPAAGLAAAYSFDENAGATVLDASGNANTGAISGATWTTGRFGSALSFDGVNDRVSVNGASSLNLGSAMTLEAWVQPTAFQSGWRTIIQKEPDAYFLNGSNDSGALRPSGGANFPSAGTVWTSGTTALTVGTWTHVALTYNGSILQLYVNGALAATHSVNGATAATASPLWIGGNSPYGEYFQGFIDEVRVYSRALSQSEVQIDMNLPVNGTPAPDTTAPVVTITAPTNGTTHATSSGVLSLGGTATDNVAVTQVTWSNDRGGSGAATGTAAWSVTGINLQSGLNVLTVTAVDAAGNPSTDTLNVTYTAGAPDTTPPVATITVPTNGTIHSTTSATLSLGGTATDNVAVTQVTWSNDRGGGGTATGAATWSVTGIALQSGLNVLTVTALDAAGNPGTDTLSVTYTPDTIVPVATITTPTNGTTHSTTSATLSLGGTATDNVAVTQVTWSNDRGGSGTATGTATWSVTGINLQSGVNVLTVTARDAAGNPGTDTLSVTYTPTGGVGLAAAYAFDENTGVTVADVSGNANTGTITGAVWAAGRFGSALSFDGVNDRVFVNNSTSVSVTTGMTLEAWVQPTAAQSGWRTIVQKEPDAYFLNGSNDTGALRPSGGGSFAGGGTWTTATTPLAVGTWTHLALTYNGTVVQLYVNGVPAGSTGASGAIAATTSPLWIGGNSPYGEYFQGLIDEVRIYNRALSQAEIQTDMTTPVGGSGTDTTAPTAPAGLGATAISSTRVDLSWSASTDNVGVTAYLLERCQTPGCASFTALATVTSGTTYSDTTATVGTSHSYRVRARDAANNLSGFSNTATAVTPAAGDTTPPTAPAGLGATAISSTRVDLSWTASTDNVGVTAYLLERCQTPGCASFTALATVTSGTTYSDTTASPATSHSYRVQARDAANNLSGFSNTATGVTPAAPDTTAPVVTITVPTNLATHATTSATLSLGGTATDNVAVTQVTWSNDRGGSGTATGTATWSVATITLQSGANVLTVTGVDAAGNPGTDTLTVTYTPPDTTAPTVPANLTATAIASTRIDLAWTASTDNVGVTAYVIERCAGVGCTFAALTTVAPSTAYSDTTVIPLTTYNYRISARDAATNQSGVSNTATALTPATPDTSPPTAPSGLSAVPASSTRIDLSWTASTDNVAVTAYQIERCQGASCTGFAALTTVTLGTTFADTTVSASTTYRYRVRATDAATNTSGFSNIATGVTPAAPDTIAPTVPSNFTATPFSASRVDLAWTASTDNVGVTAYLIERCQGAGCSNFAALTTVTSGTTFSNTGLAAGTSYSYRVQARDAANNLSAFSSTATATTLDTTAPTAPTGLATTLVSSTRVDLGWTASTDNVGVTGYQLQRCTGASCTSWALLATVTTGTTHGDTTVAPSTTYRYRVRATDAANNLSGFSNIVSATTPAAPDTTAPVATITAPTNGTTHATTSATLSLGGTATDNVAVTQVTWSNSRGGSGTATGTATWSVTGITLQSGSNVLTVTARDAAGNLGTDTLDVTYTPPTGGAGLAAAYGFDENTGVTVTDASGNSNTGTITGAVWAAGRFGNALSFDGVNDRLFVNSATSLNLGAAMTLEAWVQPTAAQSGWRTIVQKEPDAYFLNGSNDTGALRPSGGGSFAGGGTWTTATTPLAVGTWTHLALTYNGTVVQLYVNGVPAGSTGASGAIAATTSPLWIGGNSPYGEYFQGLIDEVRIYNRALSQAEIQTDMTTPVGGSGTDTTAPTAPAGLGATAISSTRVDLSWSASTDNVGVTAYLLERCQTPGCASFTALATVTSGTTYSDTTATVGTSHSYRVRARDAANNLSGFSNTATAVTPSAPDTTAPVVTITAPTNGATYPTTSATLSLGGTATDNVAVTQVTWLNDRGGSGTATGTATWSVATITLQSGVNVLTVTGVDAAGNPGTDTLTVTYTPPAPDTVAPVVTITAPTNGTTHATTSGLLNLGGTATDNVAVTQVSWSNSRGGSGAASGTGTWSVTGVALQSGLNVLTVTALDAAGNPGTDTLDVTYTPPSGGAGLVAAYSFNENSGATATDASGNSNTGAITGPVWVAGRFGSALSFDGVDDRVFVNNSTSVSVTTGMTLEAWVQPTAAQSGWRTIIQKETDAYFLNGSNDTGALRPSGGGYFLGSGGTWTTATTPMAVAAWTHLALTYNGTVVQLYVNGVPTASTGASGLVLTTTSPLWIGGNSPYGEYFQGLIDEVRVYNRALSQAEIQTDMTTPVTP